MKYAVMTTRKHNNPINWNEMEASISDVLDGTRIQWFAINEHNHGSFVTFASNKVYEQHKAKIAVYRKEQIALRDTEMTV